MADDKMDPAAGSDTPAQADEGAGGSPTYSPPTEAPPTEAPQAPAAPPAPQAVPSWTPPVTPPPDRHHGGSREARSGGVLGGVILIVLGLIFLANQFIPGIDIGRLWPLILVAIGIGIIFRRR
jgi:uncharacterized membrane protein